jgi:hypothetical protein
MNEMVRMLDVLINKTMEPARRLVELVNQQAGRQVPTGQGYVFRAKLKQTCRRLLLEYIMQKKYCHLIDMHGPVRCDPAS